MSHCSPSHPPRCRRSCLQNFLELYSLGKELGHGQFGTVYECTAKTGPDRAKYAVKVRVCRRSPLDEHRCSLTLPGVRVLSPQVINKSKIKCPEDLADVQREVAILYLLAGHPNVVCVKDAYEDSKAVYLVMELCTGGELFDRIVELGHYSEHKAAQMFRTMLDMVHHCHTLGVVHRDLKPENFLLSGKGDAGVLKATDFGLSAFFKDGDELTDMVGSPYYVAPEVLRRKYGRECDMWSAGVILYILLGGLPPFWGNSEKEIFDSIMKGKVDFSEDPWPSISASAKDLVKRLLTHNRAERLTVTQALAHPWLKQGGASDVALDSAVLKRMRTFANQSKFKQLGMMMLVHHLKKEELAGLREMFLEMDVDKSGTITLDELRQGLQHHGAALANADVEALMNSCDVDGSHELSYDEFLAATVQMHKLESQQNLHQAFDDFDTDHSGSISPDELANKLMELNVKATRQEVLDMIHEADLDGDGQIDFQEFLTMMVSQTGPHPPGASASAGRGCTDAMQCVHSPPLTDPSRRARSLLRRLASFTAPTTTTHTLWRGSAS